MDINEQLDISGKVWKEYLYSLHFDATLELDEALGGMACIVWLIKSYDSR